MDATDEAFFKISAYVKYYQLRKHKAIPASQKFIQFISITGIGGRGLGGK